MEPRHVTKRPVYVLGAGFSRAVSAHMPLTDALGESVRERLRMTWPDEGGDVSFEERLTVLSTPLPFLQGYRNTQRRAEAERITAALAEELDARLKDVLSEGPPHWLLQLVALWHLERAIVLTFNYDTIVESAVGTVRPVLSTPSGDIAMSVLGTQVVYPAPAPVGAGTLGETAPAEADSFQLLKLHGSLSWFWSLGDSSSVVRDPSASAFGSRPRTAARIAGTNTLDRFLIPPVLSKDSYYNLNIAHVLWRTAYEAIRNAESVTILGYSIPAGDRITAELLRATPTGTATHLVNLALGDAADAPSPLGRAATLGLSVESTWSGENAVAGYVHDRLDRRSANFADSHAFADHRNLAVIVTASLQRFGGEPRTFTLRRGPREATGVDLNRYEAARSDMPPHELSLQGLPRGMARLEDFYTTRSLRDAVADGTPFRVHLGDERFVAVGVEFANVGRWPVLALQLVPASIGRQEHVDGYTADTAPMR